MKVLFLDFDGVLITRRARLAAGGRDPSSAFADPVAIQVVRKLGQVGVKLVVTSQRRSDPEKVAAFLVEHGLFDYLHQDWLTTQLDDCTSNRRGMEIGAWLATHPPVSYRVVDDDSGMLPAQRPWWVLCTYDDGISAEGIANLLQFGRGGEQPEQEDE
jgi:proteasome lid subunit RPN8/RPN11